MEEKKPETFLDPSKELEVTEDLKLEGFPLEFEKQMSKIQVPYEEKKPIRVGTYSSRNTSNLEAYRKKRKKRNRMAKQSRKINRKK